MLVNQLEHLMSIRRFGDTLGALQAASSGLRQERVTVLQDGVDFARVINLGLSLACPDGRYRAILF